MNGCSGAQAPEHHLPAHPRGIMRRQTCRR
jgi:hypothetical protein